MNKWRSCVGYVQQIMVIPSNGIHGCQMEPVSEMPMTVFITYGCQMLSFNYSLFLIYVVCSCHILSTDVRCLSFIWCLMLDVELCHLLASDFTSNCPGLSMAFNHRYWLSYDDFKVKWKMLNLKLLARRLRLKQFRALYL